MSGIVYIIIKVLIYILFFTGCWFLIGRFIPVLFKKDKKKSRFSSLKGGRENDFYSHIRSLLYLTFGISGEDSVFYFLFFSIFLFLFCFVILTGFYGFSLLFIFISVFVGCLPYIILILRLKGLQIKGSYEAVNVISEISNMYKMSNYNMVAAIDNAVTSIKESPVSKRALFKLSLSLKEYKDKEELQKVIDEFVSAYDTEWAKILGINIYEAVLNGTNVELSLDDLLSGMKDIKTTIEKSKRANREAFNMVKFFVPVVYIFSIFLATEYFGFTFEKFLYFQFRTGLGIKLFIAIIAVWVASYFLTYLLSRPKFDY